MPRRNKKQKTDGSANKNLPVKGEGEGDGDETPRPERKRTDVRDKARPNKAFTSFYKANFVESGYMTEEEYEKFVEMMAKPLPTTFWITPTDSQAGFVKETLHSYRRKAEEDQEKGIVVKPIPWIPNDMGWFIDAPRVLLRKDPTFAPLHKFLILHTERGVINRQEEASMVPVHLLDITSGSRCLDMCAAPGSKTAQMLSSLAVANLAQNGKGSSSLQESVQSVFTGRIDYSADEGLVVANDMSTDRVNILVHQIKRLSTLYPLALFTSHDSRYYPSVMNSDEGSHPSSRIPFTRILADVMCSGDGTFRKAPHMWREWHPKNSIQLHKDQVLVALRAAKLLQIGGKFVYSTCSLSPIENEAAVCHILRKTNGGLRLADARKLTNINSAPGMKTWKVMCPKKYTMFKTHSEAKEAGSKMVREYHFPPEDEGLKEEMTKCLRLFPHMGDFGGFFVAVFEKVAEIGKTDKICPDDEVLAYDSETEEDRESLEREAQLKKLQAAVETAPNDIEKAKAAAKLTRTCNNGTLQREIARYISLIDALPAVVSRLREFFTLDKDFPVHQLICRYHLEQKSTGELVQPHEGVPNQILFCSKGVSETIRHGLASKKQLRIVNCGLRFLVRDRRIDSQDATKSAGEPNLTCRIAQEAVPLIHPYVASRVLSLSATADTVQILTKTDKSMPVEAITSQSKPEWKALTPGGCIALLKTASGLDLPVSALRTKHAVMLYIDDNDIIGIREICGVKV
eukprot:TRINITY_DN8749_c0_g1_i1.p1 TRINITY_DN8749_c0_g1~~TRINITY_DN8749_c0_g1_i1.p1  ORF type:complete len:742 (+),score=162.74 TRINITY_DN8749_c0_g1_i1:48-2273(+)